MSAKSVVVTGAATGIGAETVRQLRAAGAHVTGVDIAAPTGTVDAYVPVDLGDPAAIDRAVAALEGPFDALCNIAGLPPREGLSAPILSVNFLGFRRFTAAMLDRMAPGASIGAIVPVVQGPKGCSRSPIRRCATSWSRRCAATCGR